MSDNEPKCPACGQAETGVTSGLSCTQWWGCGSYTNDGMFVQSHACRSGQVKRDIDSLTAERDRYKAALEEIAAHRPPSLESAEGDIARAALEEILTDAQSVSGAAAELDRYRSREQRWLKLCDFLAEEHNPAKFGGCCQCDWCLEYYRLCKEASDERTGS